jgi:peptide/nickel transport system permease protein
MLGYIARRLLQMIPLLVALSIIIFIILQLPPGDYITMYIENLRLQGTDVSQSEILHMRELYNLDKPVSQQYLIWIGNIVRHGDFGWSMAWSRPVTEIISERLLLTMIVSFLTIIFVYAVSIPIGIYSATHQYALSDYFFTFIGFIGISVPGFLLALAIIYVIFDKTGVAMTGLFSPQFESAPWSLAKVANMMTRIWLPMVIIGLSGTASLIRIVRGMLLDELQKQYVITARAKGVAERKLLLKYPVRVAINPVISTIGWLLPTIISGESLVSIVLNMPTTGPVLLKALLAQDMYLAGSFLLVTSALTVIGTLVSDILLALLDPRIRFGGVGEET